MPTPETLSEVITGIIMKKKLPVGCDSDVSAELRQKELTTREKIQVVRFEIETLLRNAHEGINTINQVWATSPTDDAGRASRAKIEAVMESKIRFLKALTRELSSKETDISFNGYDE